MLKELKLTNFRIFHEEVTVRFRPITVLIGRNSSGKSSIVKFLLMLQQSLNPSSSQFLSPEGDNVRLGHFSALRNTHPGNKKRNLTFKLTATNPIPHAGAEVLDLYHDLERPERVYKASATLSYTSKANIGHANYSLANKTTGKTIIKDSSHILEDSPFLGGPDMPNIRSTIQDASGHLPNNDDTTASRRQVLKIMRDFSMTIELISTLRHQLHSIRHLSPVRDESQKVIIASPPPSDYVGQRGQYALPHLQQITSEDSESYEFILPHLENIAGIESIDFKTSSGYLSQAFAKSKTTKADVLISDYGFGVSQCIPIIVQGAIMPPQTSLMIEQPEAQLHPTAQLEMGSFFADLWNKRQVGSIIETHSSNILLRLRRLIGKGDLSNEDVSVAYFTVDEDNRNMPIIKNLDINDDGSMEPGLPMEFFAADVIEGLNLGARV